MLWLSDEAIEYAVAKCRRERGYKIGIALNSRAKHNDVELCLRACLRDSDDFRVRRGGSNMMIEFHNGSYIKVISASDNARGNRLHLLIADEDINDEVLSCVLRPCEILESIERQRRRNTDTFRAEYLSRSMQTTGLWAREFLNIDDNMEVADVSEEEFMKILNIPFIKETKGI